MVSNDIIRFAAIIDDAGDPVMLDQSIRHHLMIGTQRILVCLRGSQTMEASAHAGDTRVRCLPAATGAEAQSSAAFRELMQWAEPEWILFAESDEFWLPRDKVLADVGGRNEYDVLFVQRFNTPMFRTADGSLRPPNLGMVRSQPLITAGEAIHDAYLSGDTDTPWVMGSNAPALMVRSAFLRRLDGGGGPDAVAAGGARVHVPDDLLIVRAPFTSEDRFRREVAAHEAGPNWAYWRQLDDAGLAAEFRRQCFRDSALPALQAQGILAPASLVFGKLPARPSPSDSEAWRSFVARLTGQPLRPAPVAAPTAAVATRTAAPASPVGAVHAPARKVASAADCIFYHCMDIPGHGEVLGQWDLRGRERIYLGGVDLYGKSVLEVGTASGFMAFWMESQGADVTSFDLDEHQEWDIVEFAGRDRTAALAARKSAIRMINNAWWFVHDRMQSNAKVVYGSVYNLDKIKQTYDVVTVCSVMLHLRDPFRALVQAAARSHDKIIVTDLASRHFFGADAPETAQYSMHFFPRVSNNGPDDTWWVVSETLAEEFLRILGFRNIQRTYHTQRFMPDQDWHFYTLVGTR
jgi:SAM-dependent methyltransferase